jgi:hypothetical protein
MKKILIDNFYMTILRIQEETEDNMFLMTVKNATHVV